MSVRASAVARHEDQIDQSEQRAIAARADNDSRPRTALEAMAQRLSVTPKALQSTLMNTAFKNCSEAEFVALVIVANAFDLNPLLREIYAFPKKGGGIQAIVGYDGWIKIADRHPQYDGYEADHIKDAKGVIEAIEGICYRKDRTHPTKKMVYLKEFKRNTEPWNNSPNHMLDVRCFCQTIRLGLGVSGLGVEGVDDIDGGELRHARTPALPSNQSLEEELDDEIPAFDSKTGEVIETNQRGMTEVDEETARALDAGEAGAEQPEQDGKDAANAEPEAGADETEESPTEAKLRDIRERCAVAATKEAITKVDADWVKARAAYDDDTASAVDVEITAKMKAISAKGEEGGK